MSRRAICHEPPGTGSPALSPGSRWVRASACQPRSGVYASSGCGSEFSAAPCSAASARSARIDVVDATGADLDAAVQAPPGELGDPLQHRGPHVQLDLLAHAQVLVEEVRQPVARARPRLDAELEQLVVLRGE